MANPEHTTNPDARRNDPMHPHDAATTPGNPGRADGGTRRLNETAPAETTQTRAEDKPVSASCATEARPKQRQAPRNASGVATTARERKPGESHTGLT